MLRFVVLAELYRRCRSRPIYDTHSLEIFRPPAGHRTKDARRHRLLLLLTVRVSYPVFSLDICRLPVMYMESVSTFRIALFKGSVMQLENFW